MAPEEYINPAQKEILLIEVIRKQLVRALLIYLLVSNVFVFLRMVLRLMGADPENFFAGFIFAVSGFILLPYAGIFPQFREPIIAGRSVVDISAFISIFCSNVLVLLAISVIFIVTRMLKTKKQASETVEKSKPVDATKAEESVD
jgi:YggT family protein